MTYLILLFGIFLIIAGLALTTRPGFVVGQLLKNSDSFGLHFFAVSVRIVIGVVFIAGAAGSRYPLIINFFGWLAIITALVLCVIGREKFKCLIKWMGNITPPLQRLMGFLTFLLGCFFTYAVI